MIKIALLISVSAIVSVRTETTMEAARQLPDSPYFHSVAYPFGWGWGIAAYVLAVFKGVFLFSAFVIWTFFEAGFTRRRADAGGARGNIPNHDQWMDSIVHYVTPDATDECRREVLCDADAYTVSNPLLRVLWQNGPGMGSDCKSVTSTGRCRAITIEDVILGNIRWMFDYHDNANEASLLNKLF